MACPTPTTPSPRCATVARFYRRLRAEAGDAEYTASQIAVLAPGDGPGDHRGARPREDMWPQSMSAVIT